MSPHGGPGGGYLYRPLGGAASLFARRMSRILNTTGHVEEDLERYFQILIEAGRLPASTSPRDFVKRVYRKPEDV